MIAPITLQRLAAATSGQLCGEGVENLVFERVCTDSRAIEAGDLFVALSGEHFDGNQFAAAAAKAGAVAGLFSRESDVLPAVVVKDTRLALGQLAKLNRDSFAGELIALTGSSGKTSTKEMLAAILGQRAPVYATEGNFNNEIGLPLSLLNIGPEHRYAVVEMGAAKRGDIRYLCQFAQPQVALLTNAQPAHIAGFGSMEGVAKTKGEIFTALPATGKAIINADDDFCDLWVEMASHCQRLLFSLEKPADIWASNIAVTAEGGSRFVMHSLAGDCAIELPLPGRHMVANALAAAAAALALGLGLDEIKAGLAELSPVAGRLSRQRVAGVLLIDDSYNANPGSVKAAIDVLSNCAGSKTLVLGTMAELGDSAAEMHRQVALLAKQAGVDNLMLCGEFAEEMATAFAEGAQVFVDKADLARALVQQLQSGDSVLVKGSRSAAMDTLVKDIEALLRARNGGSS